MNISLKDGYRGKLTIHPTLSYSEGLYRPVRSEDSGSLYLQ